MLKINKMPSYLSPSALNQAEKMPNFFYLTRLFDPPMKKDIQPIPAAIGTVFDIEIKKQLIADKLPNRRDKLNDIKNSLERDTSEIRKKGKDIFNEYLNLAYKPDEYIDVEMQNFKKVKDIPIFGKLDASVSDPYTKKEIPLDWKVTGSNSKSGASPKPAYYEVMEGYKKQPFHKKYYEGIKIEEIDEMWALQGCTYGWLLGYEFGQEFNVRFDQIACRPKGKKIAKYIGLVSSSFQKRSLDRYKKLWTSINDGSFINNLASKTDLGLVILNSLDETWF